MQFTENIINCKYTTASFTADNVTAIQNSSDKTGYLAVSLASSGTVDNVGGVEPLVQLTPDAGKVYGAVVTVNTATQRCGVLRSGVVPFNKGAATVIADLDNAPAGIIGAGGNGIVNVVDTSGEGTGTVVARSGDTTNVLYVDLDVSSAIVHTP